MAAFAFPFASGLGSGFAFVPTTPGTSLLDSLGATPASSLTGQLDQLIDPVTMDYVRTEDGEWAETADSRTIMFIAMTQRLGESPFDPDHGTAIFRLLEQGLLSPEMAQAETERVGAFLTAQGVLTDFEVTIKDERGEYLVGDDDRLVISTNWRDLSSGSPINQTFQPG